VSKAGDERFAIRKRSLELEYETRNKSLFDALRIAGHEPRVEATEHADLKFGSSDWRLT